MASILWGTEGAEPDHGFDFWRETVCRAVLNVETEAPDPAQSFAGSLIGQSYGDIRVASFRSTGHDVVRTARHIAHGADEGILVSLQEQGDCQLSQGEERLLLRPGEIGLVDSARPFRLSFVQEVRRTVAVLPRRALLLKAPWLASARTRRIALDAPFLHLARQHLLMLGRTEEALDETAANLLAENLCNLIALSTGGSTEVGREDRLLEAIQSYCRRRLSSPSLSPATTAAHFNISVRTLHMRFAGTGQSFGAWLRTSRLEAARRALLDPRRRHESIATIAYGTGFSELSAFNRSFQQIYGQTPSQFRRNGTSG